MKLKSTVALALMLMASAVSITTYGAAAAVADIQNELANDLTSTRLEFIKNINVNALESAFLDQIKKAAPLTEDIVGSIAAGDWNKLATTLNEQNIDATPIVNYLIAHMDTIKKTLGNILPVIPANNSLVKSAVQEAIANLAKLDDLKNMLIAIKPYSKMTQDQKQKFVEGLKVVANSTEFAAAKEKLVATYNDILLPAFNSAKQIDLSSITTVAGMLRDKYTSGSKAFSLDDFPVVIDAVNTFRTLIPLLPEVVQGLAQTFFDINQLFLNNRYSMQAPQVIQNTLKTISDNAGNIKEKLNSAFASLDAALAQAQQELSNMTTTTVIVPEETVVVPTVVIPEDAITIEETNQ